MYALRHMYISRNTCMYLATHVYPSEKSSVMVQNGYCVIKLFLSLLTKCDTQSRSQM